MIPRFIFGLALLAGFFSSLRSSAQEAGGDLGFYQSKIAGILEEHCFKCHSAKAEKLKGGLYLDSKESILKGGEGGPVIDLANPDRSRLILAVQHADKDLAMPPKEKIPDDQIALLREWVKRGAPAPAQAKSENKYAEAEKALWSIKPLAPGRLPEVRQKDWPRDPVDFYILAKLEEQKMAPAPAASKAALFRRLSFDLTGLPPKPEALEEFLKDSSPAAVEKAVDEFLASPGFGEQWGRHWLDIARYADSSGSDNNLLFENAWRYRDYVVKSFNQDKPYNQFIREQLAGDLLPTTSIEQQHEYWIATGFLMLGPKPLALGNSEKAIADVVDEQIDVTTRALLGLTASCARCHDHKFDPIPTKDYYALAGIFRSTMSLTLPAERTAPGRNGQPWVERSMGTAEQSAAAEAFDKEFTKLQEEVTMARQMRQTLPGGIDSKALEGIVIDNSDAEVIGSWKLSNYSTNFVDKNYLHDGDEKREKGKKMVRFAPNIPEPGLYEVRLAYTARPNRATNVPVRLFPSTGPRMISLNQRVEPRYDKAFESLGVFEFAAGTNAVVEVGTENTKGFVVIDAIQFLPKDVQLAARLKESQKSLPAMMANKMVRATDQEELEYKLQDIRGKEPPLLPRAMAVREGRPQNSKINIRGEVDKLGPEVPRGFLSVVAKGISVQPDSIQKIPLKITRDDQSGRLELADWVTNPANPLTPRVMVNRIWLHLFGRGLVNTPDNFGMLGDQPTHPELLDYLAEQFVREGWSSKKMIRRIVLSRAYQMASDYQSGAEQTDPENRLLWRMNRKRLQAEALRDAMLACNGTLDPKIGGSSLALQNVPPGMPMQAGANDPLRINRRTLYLPVLRNNVPDMLQVFDFADPHTLSGKRYTTTAATQALFMMNSEFVATQSQAWADKLLASKTGDKERIENAFLVAFGRKASAEETKMALDYLKDFSQSLQQSNQGAPNAEEAKKKTWQSFCQALYQTTEFRFVD